ncbi:hypothetical protein PYCC9005_003282 [Savitreella phatthalungensis]
MLASKHALLGRILEMYKTESRLDAQRLLTLLDSRSVSEQLHRATLTYYKVWAFISVGAVEDAWKLFPRLEPEDKYELKDRLMMLAIALRDWQTGLRLWHECHRTITGNFHDGFSEYGGPPEAIAQLIDLLPNKDTFACIKCISDDVARSFRIVFRREMVFRLSRRGLSLKAYRFLQRALWQDGMLTRNEIGAVMSGCISDSRPKLAIALYDEVLADAKSGITRSPRLDAVLIRAHGEVGDLENAVKVFQGCLDDRPAHALELVRPYTSIMHAFAAAGKPQETKRYFEEFLRSGLVPDKQMLSVLVQAEVNAFDVAGVRRALARFRQYRQQPDRAVFAILHWMRAGMLDAYGSLDVLSVAQRGRVPVRTLAKLQSIDIFAARQDGDGAQEAVAQLLQGSEATTILAAIQLHLIREEFSAIENLWHGVEPDGESGSSVLLNLHLKSMILAGRSTDEILGAVQSDLARGFRQDRGTFVLLVYAKAIDTSTILQSKLLAGSLGLPVALREHCVVALSLGQLARGNREAALNVIRALQDELGKCSLPTYFILQAALRRPSASKELLRLSLRQWQREFVGVKANIDLDVANMKLSVDALFDLGVNLAGWADLPSVHKMLQICASTDDLQGAQTLWHRTVENLMAKLPREASGLVQTEGQYALSAVFEEMLAVYERTQPHRPELMRQCWEQMREAGFVADPCASKRYMLAMQRAGIDEPEQMGEITPTDAAMAEFTVLRDQLMARS